MDSYQLRQFRCIIRLHAPLQVTMTTVPDNGACVINMVVLQNVRTKEASLLFSLSYTACTQALPRVLSRHQCLWWQMRSYTFVHLLVPSFSNSNISKLPYLNSRFPPFNVRLHTAKPCLTGNVHQEEISRGGRDHDEEEDDIVAVVPDQRSN